MSQGLPPAKLPELDSVHVWWIELDNEIDGPAELLSASELEHAARFHFAQDAARYRMCRAMLRLGLGWYLGRKPRQIVLRTGKFGKPYLALSSDKYAPEGGLFFNVAHSAGLAAIAFSTRGEVGIDVEAANRTVEVMDIASAYFTPGERSLIAEAQGSKQLAAFLRIWTRKEAVLKAVGCGIPQGLNQVDVTRERVTFDGEAVTHGDYGNSDWWVRDLKPREGFAGAIAAAPGDWAIEDRQVAWGDANREFLERFPEDFRGPQ